MNRHAGRKVAPATESVVKNPRHIDAETALRARFHIADEELVKLYRMSDDEGTARPENIAKDSRRVFERYQFRDRVIVMKVMPPGGGLVEFVVGTLDLSMGGLAVVHTSFAHIGTRVFIELPRIDDQPEQILGTIVRCTHRRGTIHEIGIQFDQPIDMALFSSDAAVMNRFSVERVDPGQLQGCMVHVEPSAVDRKVVANALSESMMRIRVASSIEEAMPLVKDRLDILICEYHLDDGTAVELIQKAREAECFVPTIVLTADTSASVAQALQASAVDRVLTKPCGEDVLLRTLAGYLLTGQGERGRTSTLKQGDPGFELLGDYVGTLHTTACTIERAIDAAAIDECLKCCVSVKGTASSLGFGQIGALATDAYRRVVSDGELNRATVAALRKLAIACRAARPPRRAA